MEASELTSAIVFEDSDATFMARVLIDGGYISQANIASIQRDVYDVTIPGAEVEISSDALVVASTVFNSLQTGDARWEREKDSVGYNFKDTIPSTSFPDAPNVYQVEYKFTGSSSQVFYAVAKVRTRTIYAS